jgi:mRNA-degrading endonuclease RelE of RelBE toxin-antitoxin system
LSEEIKKIIEKKGNEVIEWVKKEIEYYVSQAEKRLVEFVEELKKVPDIKFGDLIQIIVEGGIIKVKDVEIVQGYPNPLDLEVSLSGLTMFREGGVKLDKGKYRIIFVVKPLKNEK